MFAFTTPTRRRLIGSVVQVSFPKLTVNSQLIVRAAALVAAQLATSSPGRNIRARAPSQAFLLTFYHMMCRGRDMKVESTRHEVLATSRGGG